MPFETTLDLLTLRRDGVDESQWPRLSCSQAQQAALAVGDLRLDAGREVLFQDQGQIRSFDDAHKLVFNRTGNLLELHEQGDIRFLTGGPPPTERLRILATGQVGLGTATPTQALEVVGTVKATAFQGDGAGLTGVSATDATKVAKAGDTMTGPLTITAAGTGLRVTQNAAVGGTLTIAGNLGIGTTQPSHKLTLGAGNMLLPTANLGIDGNLYFGGITDIGQTGLRLFGGLVNGTIPAGFIDVRTTNPADGLRIRVDTANGGTERMRVTADGNVGIGTTQPSHKLTLGAGNMLLPTANLGIDGNLYFGGITDIGQTGLRLFGGLVNGTIPAGFIDVRTTNPADGLRIRVDTANGGTERMRVTANGNVGVGVENPAHRLDVAGSAHATSFPTSSDERFKREVRPLTQVLEKLDKIRGISFEWNERYESLGRSTGKREIGVIAQEVEAVFPELVTTWGDGSYRAIDYGRLTAVLVEAIKRLRADTEALKQRLQAR